MKELTARQHEMLDFIVHTVKEYGYPPSLREIGDQMGIRSTNGVHDHLGRIERKGFISVVWRTARGITLSSKTKRQYGLSLSPEAQITSVAQSIQEILKIIEDGADALDLSMSIGAAQGAETALIAIRNAIQEDLL